MTAECSVRESLRSTIDYGCRLVGSGIEGASAGARRALGQASADAVIKHAMASSWKPGLAGVCLAVVASALRKRSARTTLLNGLAAGAVAFSGALLWSSSDLTAAAARGAVENVNAVRDSRWLEQHPINYA